MLEWSNERPTLGRRPLRTTLWIIAQDIVGLALVLFIIWVISTLAGVI